MVQRGERFGFALEAGEAFRIGRECLGQHFDRDIAIEARVAGPIDFAIPPAPMAERISYGPSRAPEPSGIQQWESRANSATDRHHAIGKKSVRRRSVAQIPAGIRAAYRSLGMRQKSHDESWGPARRNRHVDARIQRVVGRAAGCRSTACLTSNQCADHGRERGNQLDDVRTWCDAETRRTRVNGFIGSALIGFAAILLGLLIVHFSSDEPRKKANK